MAEIYINRTSPIKTKIFWSGNITDADDDVSAKIYDITEDLNSNSVIAIFTATKDETDLGTYQVVLPYEFCTELKRYKVIWEYEVNGDEGAHTDFFDVVAPYANISDVFEDLNFGTDPSDPNFKSYHDIQMAEKYARKLIEAYTTQFFYPYKDTHVAYGYGSDILPLPFKINELTSLYENDNLLYEIDGTELNWNYVPMIAESGFGLRVNRQNQLDNMIYTSNGLVPPTIYDQGYSGAFKKDYRYVVTGKFGWTYVPDNVEEACIILINDFFNQDKAWRNRYVSKIQTFDWSFEFAEDAHRGTGNLYADQLLQPYVLTGMIVV